MAANARVGYLNYADAATLTATPAATTGTAVTYLQNDSRGDVFGGAITSQVIKGTWGGTSYTVSNFSLWRTNLASTDTVQLQLHANADWTGTVTYNSGAVAVSAAGLFTDWGWSFICRYFTAAACKSFTITIVAAAAPQISRLYLGPYTEAPLNPAEGATIGYETNAKQNRSEGGSLRSLAKADWRVLTFDMMLQTEANRAIWLEIARYCGVVKPLLFCLNPDDTSYDFRDHTMFGKFDKSPMMRLTGPYQYDWSAKLLEL